MFDSWYKCGGVGSVGKGLTSRGLCVGHGAYEGLSALCVCVCV